MRTDQRWVARFASRAFVGLVQAVLLLTLLSVPTGAEAQAAAPSNDRRAHARVLSGSSGTLVQTTVGATSDPGVVGATVWFRWRATHTGWETFDSRGSQAATWMNAYPPGALTSGAVFWSRVFGSGESDLYAERPFPGRYAVRHVRVTKGRDYYIQLWTERSRANTVRLTWSPRDLPGRPSNDDLADARVLTGSSGVVAGTSRGATYQPGESPLLDECPSGCGYSEGDHGPAVWFRWTAPSTGTWRFHDGEQGENALIQVYRGGPSIGGLILVKQAYGYPGSLPTALLDVKLTGGSTYTIRYGSNTYGGPFRLRWGAATGGPSPPPPPNDDLADARVISGSAGQTTGTSQWATLEPGETGPGPEARSSVWFRWTAPASGLATVGSSNYYAGTRVWTGHTIAGLQPVRATYWGVPERRPTFEAVAGTTYQIQLGGPYSWGSDFDLTWDITVPGNDDLADAFVLPAGPDGVSPKWGIVRSTAEPGEPPTDGDQPARNTVWMRWTAQRSGVVEFNTYGDHVPALDVYTGPPTATSPSALRHVGYGPHGVEFRAVAGSTYFIRLDAQLASIGYVGWHQKWDHSRPTVGASLDGGATRTRDTWVSLRLTGSDSGSGLSGWRVSMVTHSGEVLAPAWVPAWGRTSRTVTWSVTHTAYGGTRWDGVKRVYVQAFDRQGNRSAVLTRSIVLDQ